MKNTLIAKILREIGIYLEMDNVPFKPRAYEKAADAIKNIEEELNALYEREGLKGLKEIPGIGENIGKKIEELLKTGRLAYYEQWKKKIPIDLSSLHDLPGIGPKHLYTLYTKLKIRNMNDLERAAQKKLIQNLAGFGVKSEKNILQAIRLRKNSNERPILGFIMPEIQKLEQQIKNVTGVENIMVAGSIRRRCETIGDIDLVMIAKNPKRAMDFFVSMPDVAHVYSYGKTKSMIRLQNGLDVDLRIVPKNSFGAAVNYFTGSKSHNIALRERAKKRGWKLNEYGLFKGKKQIGGMTEDDLYEKLGLRHIEPEMRENFGEIELAEKNKLPSLIGYDDLQGDLQVQTDWSDGQHSILEMAKSASKAGLRYIAITDHTKSLTITNGLDEKRIKKQWNEIDRVNKILKGKITVLKGTECDILKDGKLDLPDRILEQLDIVGVSVHTYFHLTNEEQTKRILQAISNPWVDILFHATGRLINRRRPYDADIIKIMEHAKTLGTTLEINSSPQRLDLKDEYIRQCVKTGINLCIDSDAHNTYHFSYLEHGISQARRGWAEKKNIINAWPLEKMKSFLKKKKEFREKCNKTVTIESQPAECAEKK